MPTGELINMEANFRFQPAAGRFVILEVDRGSSTQAWNIGEVELYGWRGDRTAMRDDVVVQDAGAPAPLRLAAEELSYYLGEIAGHPVPIVSSREAKRARGLLFRIDDLRPLCRTPEQMEDSRARGLLPETPIHIERDGRTVTLRAWPYRNVLWSVWAFLERQGVRWLYPDAHGDYVPTGKGIRLGFLPLRETPPTDYVYANFGVELLRGNPDAFLHFWRNGWTHTWGGHERDVFGGEEVPRAKRPAGERQPDFAEGFEGYPHNFHNVLPDRILARNPEWCGIVTNPQWAVIAGASNLNRRLPPSRNWTTFNMSSAGARDFVVRKALACVVPPARDAILWLLPEDGLWFSEDPESLALRGPLRTDDLPYVMPYPYSASGDYYDFVRYVASNLQAALPSVTIGAMAYSNTHLPPPDGKTIPSNVLVEVCIYGARNLPLDDPANDEMRGRLLAWRKQASQLRHYSYDLIHQEKAALPAPVPLVKALADRARFFRANGMPAGGTQADLPSLPFNPWNFYAYPRLHRQPQLDDEEVLKEFFHGYYRESGAAMLAYYRAIEDFQTSHHIAIPRRGYDYVPDAASYPADVLRDMQGHLDDAGEAARYWVTRERVARAQEGFDWLVGRLGLDSQKRDGGNQGRSTR